MWGESPRSVENLYTAEPSFIGNLEGQRPERRHAVKMVLLDITLIDSACGITGGRAQRSPSRVEPLGTRLHGRRVPRDQAGAPLQGLPRARLVARGRERL
jgi:hypothetical protein